MGLAGKRRAESLYPVLRGSAGSVLLVLIITMVILAVLSAALLPTLFTTEMGQVSATQAMKAYYLAEAGGRYTLPRLQDIAIGTHTVKFSDGSTFFQIEKISNAEFTSTGVLNEGLDLEARVAITYRSERMFDYGIFGGDGVTIGNSGLVDSYSSSGSSTDGENGNVGTNSDNLAGISGSAVLHGDRDVSVGKSMTPEDLPAGAVSWTDKTSELVMLSNGQTVNLGAGEYSADAIDISNNSTVNITGDVVIYVEGTTTASNNSTLSINSGASLTIYAGGDIDLSNNSTNNVDNTPSSFIIYGLAGCDSIDLSNNSDTYAAIYAPNADIDAGNNADFYGALVGATITVGNNARVHYDEDLQDIDSDSTVFEQCFTEN